MKGPRRRPRAELPGKLGWREWEEQWKTPKHPEIKQLRRSKSRILGPQEPREGSFKKDDGPIDGNGMQKRAPEDAEQGKARTQNRERP